VRLFAVSSASIRKRHDHTYSRRGNLMTAVRSLPLKDWPPADRLAWEAACRPAKRLARGGVPAIWHP
jgi:hypothetical protein